MKILAFSHNFTDFTGWYIQAKHNSALQALIFNKKKINKNKITHFKKSRTKEEVNNNTAATKISK